MIANKTILEDGDFIIILTIDGSEYEEVELKVQDPNKSLLEIVDNIVRVFELPKLDPAGNPTVYMLVLELDAGEYTVLDYQDEYGRDTIMDDYHIQSGDHLHLIRQVIAG